MSFNEFVLWLGSPVALGVASSVALTLIKMVAPQVKDKLAIILSIVLAGISSSAAIMFKPYLGQMPPWVQTFWPVFTWAFQQIWWEITKPKTTQTQREQLV